MPSSRRDLDVAVLDADQRQSLVAIRSLGRSGLAVGAFDVKPGVPAYRSRWCVVSGQLPRFADDEDAFVAAVLDLIDRHRPRVLIVAHDGTIEVLRRHRSRIEEHTTIALAPEPALAVAVSKQRTLALAEEQAIDIPRSVLVQTPDEVPAALEQTNLPAVLKPLTSWVEHEGRRARLRAKLVINPREGDAAARELFDRGSQQLIVQEWLPGAREAVWLLYTGDEISARFVQVAHRMFPPLGGGSVLRESIAPATELVQPAERLVRAGGVTGLSEVEFRRDREGRPRLMEINPRMSASLEVAVRAGIDFPVLLYRWAAGLPLPQTTEYRTGVRMRWLAGDLLWLRETLKTQGRPDATPRRKALRTFASDCFRPAGYDYLNLSDPYPALAATAGFLRASSQKAIRQKAPALAKPGVRPRLEGRGEP